MTYKITDYNGEEIQGSFYEGRTSKDEARHIQDRKNNNTTMK